MQKPIMPIALSGSLLFAAVVLISVASVLSSLHLASLIGVSRRNKVRI